MTKEQELNIIFANEIIKPWEDLNSDLSKHYSVSPKHSIFTNKAHALAISLKHISEANGGLKSRELNQNSKSYSLIADLADTKKHGERDNPLRECTISTSSLYERKFEKVVLLRFLRNKITMDHATHGKNDFMEIAKDCALFLGTQLNITHSWKPIVYNNSGAFSNKVETYASVDNQVIWTGCNFSVVELNGDDEYISVEIDGTIEFHLTSEF